MKTYILASVIPSRISAKLYYLHIINTYVRHYKNSSGGGPLNCSPVHICCYRITIVWICIIFYLPVFEAIQVLEEVGNAAHFSLGVAKMSSLDQFCQEAI